MNKILTVVVPVYKVEQYINKCLGSLVVPEELMGLLEVIVVNDGTPDNSAIMAKEFEKKFPHTFRVIDKENGGHGSCCNVGLREAKGKYIHFLDSDDWFDENFPLYLEKLAKEDADVVFTHCVKEFAKSGISKVHSLKLEYDKQYEFRTIPFDLLTHDTFSLHECSYSVDLLRKNEIAFLERCSYDDTILRLAPIPLVKQISLYDLSLYHYLLEREGQSMDKKVFAKKLPQLLENIRSLFEHCNNVEKELDEATQQFCQKVLNSYIMYFWGSIWILRKNILDCYRKFCLTHNIFHQDENAHWLHHLGLVRSCNKYSAPIAFLHYLYCIKSRRIGLFFPC